MPTRTITVDGTTWRVFPSGFVTQYDLDEFGLIFVSGEEGARQVRVTRYSPTTTRSRERSLAELSDERLAELLVHSQPSDTSPEAGYRASTLPGAGA
jgi:hypothetical protein